MISDLYLTFILCNPFSLVNQPNLLKVSEILREGYSLALLLLFSHSLVSDSLQPHGLQHARLPCPSLSAGVCSISCP